MPRPRKNQKKTGHTTRRRSKNTGCTALVVIDDAPLRKKAVKDCRSVIRQRDKARKEWQRFEQEDTPAFSRWYHREFGADLTRLRELRQEINDLAEMVREVEYLSVFSQDPEWVIYATFKRRREAMERGGHPSDEDEEDEYPDEEEEDGDGLDDEDEFDEFDDDWEEEFEEEERRFWEEFERFFENGGQNGRHHMEDHHQGRGNQDPHGTAARVKEIYRTLVRRLHPDMIPENDVVRMDLWNAVQDAYRERDLERLEMLLSTLEMEEGVVSENTPLSRLRETWRHIKDAVNAFRRQIRMAKKEPAWMFSAKNAVELRSIHQSISRDIREDINHGEGCLKDLRKQIDRWERQMVEAASVPTPPPHKPTQPKARARPRRRPAPERDPRQTEFSF